MSAGQESSDLPRCGREPRPASETGARPWRLGVRLWQMRVTVPRRPREWVTLRGVQSFLRPMSHEGDLPPEGAAGRHGTPPPWFSQRAWPLGRVQRAVLGWGSRGRQRLGPHGGRQRAFRPCLVGLAPGHHPHTLASVAGVPPRGLGRERTQTCILPQPGRERPGEAPKLPRLGALRSAPAFPVPATLRNTHPFLSSSSVAPPLRPVGSPRAQRLKVMWLEVALPCSSLL